MRRVARIALGIVADPWLHLALFVAGFPRLCHAIRALNAYLAR